jgi:hypothetical protein
LKDEFEYNQLTKSKNVKEKTKTEPKLRKLQKTAKLNSSESSLKFGVDVSHLLRKDKK